MISSWWDNLHKTKWGLHRSKKPNKDDSNHDVAHIRPHHTLNGFFSNFPQSFQSFITLGHCWHGWGRSWYWIGPDWNLSLQRFISDYPHFPARRLGDGIVSKAGIPKTWKKKKKWKVFGLSALVWYHDTNAREIISTRYRNPVSINVLKSSNIRLSL